MMIKKILALALLLVASAYAISVTLMPYPGSPAYVNPSGDLRYYSSVFFYWGISGQLWSSCTPNTCTESDGQSCQNAGCTPTSYGGTCGGSCGRTHSVSCNVGCTPVAPATSCSYSSCSDGYGTCSKSGTCTGGACSVPCSTTTTLYCTSQCSQPTATCSVLFDGSSTLSGSRAGVLYTASKSGASTCVWHTGSISCTDVDGSVSSPVSVPTFKLHSVPTPTLSPSSLDVAASAGGTPVTLSWTVGGCVGDTISCTLGIDPNLPSKVTQPVTCSGASTCTTTYTFPAGDVCDHQWNVTCQDSYFQNATSATGTINLLIPSCMNVNPSHSSATCKLSQDMSSAGDCIAIDKQKSLTLDCQGKKITGTSGTGILLTNSNNTNMQNCFVSGFSTDIAIRDSLTTSISSSTAEKASIVGIEVTRSNSTSMSTVTFSKNAVGANATWSPSSKASSSTFSENTVGFYAGFSNSTEITSSTFSKNPYGAIIDNSYSFKASSDTFKESTQAALALASSPKATISGSSFSSGGMGAYAYKSDSLSSSSNKFYDNVYGLQVENCNKTSISGDEFYNDSEFGIGVTSSNGTSISGVKAHDFPSSGTCPASSHCTGILLDASNFTTISGSGVFQKNLVSIRAENSRNTTITGNGFASDNTSIWMVDSKKANITQNVILGAATAGIEISGSDNAIVYTNWIYSSGIGLYFTSSSANTNTNCLFFNNYLNNTVNALGEGDSSTVGGNIPKKAGINVLGCTSLGGYLGGNAWFDPAGGGESTTCDDLDGDCLCDLPYAANSLSDSLPLATNQGFLFTIPIDTIDGNTAGTADQFSGKTYVATTTSPNPVVAFRAVTIFPGSFNCKSSRGGSTTVSAGETGTVTVSPAIGEGCYDITINCTNSLLPANSNVSAPSYFCMDTSPPSVVFLDRAETRGKVTNPTNGETLAKHSLTLKANITDTVTFAIYCTLEWNGTNETFAPTLSSDGRDQYCSIKKSNLTNGTYYYRMFAQDAGENIGVSDGGALRTVIIDAPPLAGGCEDCENLGNFSSSTIFLTLNKASNELKVVFYSENASTGERTLLAGVPIIVWVTNSTYKNLTKIITGSSADDLGVARFKYSQWNTTTMDYTFIYCCYFEDCGFDMCINGFGVDWNYMDQYNMYDMFTIPNATTSQPDLNITQLDILPAVSTIEVKPDVCKATDIECKARAYQDALCTPIALLFGFLMAALYYTGKNPFGFLDASPLRIGSHIRYNPRGAQTGIRITASQATSLASSATNATVGAVKDVKKSGGKVTAGSVTKQMGKNAWEGLKGSAARDTNMVKLIFSPVALAAHLVAAATPGTGATAKGAWESFSNKWTGSSAMQASQGQRIGSAALAQAGVGAAGGGFAGHFINSLINASKEGAKGKTFFGKLGKFSVGFAAAIVGGSYIKAIVQQHKANALLIDAQREAQKRAQSGEVKNENDKKMVEYNKLKADYEKQKAQNTVAAQKKAEYEANMKQLSTSILSLSKYIVKIKEGEKQPAGTSTYKNTVYAKEGATGARVEQLQKTLNDVMAQPKIIEQAKKMGIVLGPELKSGINDRKTLEAVANIERILSSDKSIVNPGTKTIGTTGVTLDAHGIGKSDKGYAGPEVLAMLQTFQEKTKAPEAPKPLGAEPVKPEETKAPTRLDILHEWEAKEIATARSDKGPMSYSSIESIQSKYQDTYKLDKAFTQMESSIASGASGGGAGIFSMNLVSAAFGMDRTVHEGMFPSEVKDVLKKDDAFKNDKVEITVAGGTKEKMTKLEALNSPLVSGETKQGIQKEYNQIAVQVAEAAHIMNINSVTQTNAMALNSAADLAKPEFQEALKKAASDPVLKTCEKLENDFNSGKGSVATAEAVMKEMAKGDGLFAPAAAAALEKMKQYEGNPEAKAGAAREFISTMAYSSEQFSEGKLAKDMGAFSINSGKLNTELSAMRELERANPTPELKEKIESAEKKLASMMEDNPLLDPKYSDARQAMLQDAVAKYVVTNTSSSAIILAHEGTVVADNLAKYAAAVKDVSLQIPALEAQHESEYAALAKMPPGGSDSSGTQSEYEARISEKFSGLSAKAAEIGMAGEVQDVVARFNSAKTFEEKREAALELNDKVYSTAISNAHATTNSFMNDSSNYLAYSRAVMPSTDQITNSIADKVNIHERISDFMVEENYDKLDSAGRQAAISKYLASNPRDAELMQQNGIEPKDLLISTDDFARKAAQEQVLGAYLANNPGEAQHFIDSGAIPKEFSKQLHEYKNTPDPLSSTLETRQELAVEFSEKIRGYSKMDEPAKAAAIEAYIQDHPTITHFAQEELKKYDLTPAQLAMDEDRFREQLAGQKIAGYAKDSIAASHHAELVASMSNFASPETIQKGVNDGMLAQMEDLERAIQEERILLAAKQSKPPEQPPAAGTKAPKGFEIREKK